MSATLNRQATGLSTPPVRMLHLGLGNFYRAHQAWYTQHASDADQWGYAAFTGRSPAVADAMNGQDGLYTLLVRGEDGDRTEVIASITQVSPGTDGAAWLEQWRNPDLAVVTITVTEAGYHRNSGGSRIDATKPEVVADIELLRHGRWDQVVTAPGKLVAGMLARDQAGGGPVTVLSCDNLPDNGRVSADVVTSLAQAVDPVHAALVQRHAFATSMVDRITPRATDEDTVRVRELTGFHDAAVVVTEPFSEWVVAGNFVAGRPAWETAGATMVDDVEPYERRKLWLLNGSHSLMAYAASARGHQTVSEAINDPTVRAWVEEWWDEASRHLSLPADRLADYRAALVKRFENAQIRHLLAQIAADGSQKIPVRILPTLRAERAAGRSGSGAARAVAAWVWHLLGHGAQVQDHAGVVLAQQLDPKDLPGSVRAVLKSWDPALAQDESLTQLISSQVLELSRT